MTEYQLLRLYIRYLNLWKACRNKQSKALDTEIQELTTLEHLLSHCGIDTAESTTRRWAKTHDLPAFVPRRYPTADAAWAPVRVYVPDRNIILAVKRTKPNQLIYQTYDGSQEWRHIGTDTLLLTKSMQDICPDLLSCVPAILCLLYDNHDEDCIVLPTPSEKS